MSTATHCSRCGAALAAGASACPSCLFELGLSRPPAELDPEPERASSSAAPRPRGPAPTLAELAPLFPQLELLELLGEGGMGVVYKARQRQLGRLVALKVLPREASADPAFVERFAREARALAQLDHPRIVRVYDHGDAHGYPYLILEYVDGENLRQRMRRGALEPREALALVPQICDALQYAHDEGVVHRDIKPENILIATDGRVKVADFGLARLTGGAEPEPALTRAGEAVGTPHYMAPEQLERPRDVDHRADIYALGVVFYELLTGTLPRGKFDAPSHCVRVDVRIDDIVLKSLEHEPERRYQHALEMSDEVQAVERGPAVPAQQASPVPEPVALVPQRFSHLLGWFLAFTATWFLAGYAFNHSLTALALVGVVLALLFVTAVRALSGLRPIGPRLPHDTGELESRIRSGGRGRRELGFLIVCAGFVLLGLGLLGLWESWSPGYVPPPRDLPTLQRVLAESAQIAPDRVRDPSTVRWDVHDAPQLFQQPWLIAAGLLVLALGGARTLARSGVSRRWRASAVALACCIAPLAIFHAVAWVAEPRRPAAPVQAMLGVARDTTLDDALRTLPTCLFDDGYEMSVRAYMAPSSALALAYAEPKEVRERWRLSLFGPRRVRPAVTYVVTRGESDSSWNALAVPELVAPGAKNRGAWRDLVRAHLECASR